MKIVVFNFGCKVNQYESDVLINLLEQRGHEVSTTLKYADCYIINTCAVTNEAERKSRQAISRVKHFNKNAKIFICGCASEKNSEQFIKKENVVTVKGVANKYQLVNLIEEGENVEPLPTVFEDGVAKTTRTRSYIKIQDGCNNFCSYCIIPYLRGRSRSRQIYSILSEINSLKDVHEVVLTGIDISSYGLDINTNLVELVNSLKDCNYRIRVGSFEVRVISRELLQALKSLKNFCPQFHLSLQNGDKSVLKSMNRRYTPDEYYSKICLIREYFPNASITTDIIVGFPTETDLAFKNTLEFVKKVEFYNVHIFPYSAREGTVAYKKYKMLDKQIVSNREEQLKKIKEDCKIKYEKQFVGKTVEVLVEDVENNYKVGYTKEYIKVYCNSNLPQNTLQNIKITGLYLDGLKGE